MCPLHTEAKQYQNIRVWSRERFIEGHARRQVAPALKPPNSQKLSAKPYFRKGEGGMCVVVANFLVSDPLFLRSGHGSCKPPPKKKNVILCSEKKGQGPKAQLSPCEVQVLAKGKQVSVGSSLSARSPAPCPAVIPEEARNPGPSWPLGSSGHPNHRGWSSRLCLRQTAAAFGSQRQGWGRASPLPQGLDLARGQPW